MNTTIEEVVAQERAILAEVRKMSLDQMEHEVIRLQKLPERTYQDNRRMVAMALAVDEHYQKTASGEIEYDEK